MLSSLDTATLCGGPTTLVGAFNSAITFGGFAARSMMVTVSDAGLSATVATPLRTALLSFADTAICAEATTFSSGKASNMQASFAGQQRWRFMISPRLGYRCMRQQSA